jgi:hypothetical protein
VPEHPQIFAAWAREAAAYRDAAMAARRARVVRVSAPEPRCRGNLGQGRRVTRYEAVPQTNHFTVLDALTEPNSAMVERLAALAAAT